MEAEVEAYEYQLSQVVLGLDADPTNAELLTLKTELEEIIDLTKQALGIENDKNEPVAATKAGASDSADPTATGTAAGMSRGKVASKNKAKFKSGEHVSARYKDMKWYPARITSIDESGDQPQYTLIFKGYSTPTTLPPACLRPLDAVVAPEDATSSPVPTPSASSTMPTTTTKRKLTAAEEEREKEKRRKKNEKWAEKQKEKTQETLEKKSAWEKFGKKAAKKGVKIGGLEGKSIFRTPDNPTGKVGVVGSGQGVTSYDKMGKHKFEKVDRSGHD